jgi:hypothetical protein
LTDTLGGQFAEQEDIVWFITGRRGLTRFNGVLRTQASTGDLDALVTPVLEASRIT